MSIQGVSSSSCLKYHVFLSFRGKDTRKNFTDHLYTALKQAGINVFRDDKELERGKEISTELINAIEQSRFSIVVFSTNYASSTWCLNELVKIVECKNSRDQTVIPIFYDVAPSTVRSQSENFQEVFVEHKVGKNTEKVEKWKTALREVANIAGWVAKDCHESELVQQIVKELSSELGLSKRWNNFTGLVGLDSRLEKLKMLMGAGSDDVCMIGICGMGGIGKTTIARAIFESISSAFEGSSFVANVREISEKNDLVHLQKQLLSQILKGIEIDIWTAYDGIDMIKDRLQNRKVLIVLDDVVHAEQLNNLAAMCEWFGSGSRIIITTRDQHLLKAHGVHETYMVEKLNDDEAYQLFSLKAFKKDQPPSDFLDLIEGVVQYADGLPLALDVLGSFLFDRTIDVWRSALQRLRVSKNGVFNKLEISYDGLEKTEQRIFLDIACFYKGKDKDYVTRILDGCDFYCGIGIDVLIDKCLLTISESNKLWMHDLLQDMGHQIVNSESSNPENRSRLWKEEDIKDVLTKNTGTEAVEAIMSETELNISLNAKAFSKMKNLRLLKIKNVQLPAEGLEYLSDQLRVLIWHGCSLKSLPSSVRPDRIVQLVLSCSPIKQLWKRTTHLDKLTSIRLEDCSNLIELPDLAWAPSLMKLFIRKCPKLREIRSSCSSSLVHKKLISLEVENCTSLMTLPGSIHMESLKYFCISHCPKLKKFPEIAGRMEHLWSLTFIGTAVREMPSSIQLLIGLEALLLSDNNSLMTLPDTINGLISLESLNLFGCSNLVTLPDTINGLASLTHLHLSRCTKLENVPVSLVELSSLQWLDLSGTAIAESMWSIFHMNQCGPPSKSSCLHFLPPLIPRKNSSVMALMLPALSDLCSLIYLDLSDCNLWEIPSSFFASLPSLEILDLSRNNFLSLPITIRDLSKLGSLLLFDCKNLQYVPELPPGTALIYLDGCESLQKLSIAFISQFSMISCVNCLKLSGDDDSFQVVSIPMRGFGAQAVFPGGDIPNWVRYRSEGSSISIRMPADLYNNKLVGFIFCFLYLGYKNFLPFRVTSGEENQNFPSILVDSGLRQTKSKHICLLYFPHQSWFKQDKDNHNNLSFGLERGGKAERCGIHPIYEQDLTDFNPNWKPTNFECCHSLWKPFRA